MEVLIVISGLLQLANTLTSDAAKAKAENRDPTPDEMARMKAAQQFIEGQWAALAPKDAGEDER